MLVGRGPSFQNRSMSCGKSCSVFNAGSWGTTPWHKDETANSRDGNREKGTKWEIRLKRVCSCERASERVCVRIEFHKLFSPQIPASASVLARLQPNGTTTPGLIQVDWRKGWWGIVMGYRGRGELGNGMSCQHCPRYVHSSLGSQNGPALTFGSSQCSSFVSVFAPASSSETLNWFF